METLFDTHAHLDFPDFDDDREEVIARASRAGVRYLVSIGSGRGLEGAARAVSIAETHAQVWASVGVHPHDARLVQEGGLDEIRRLAGHDKVVAIGEIGLDYAREHSPKKVQLARFRDQLALARELNLPVVIHDREAHEDLMRVLGEDGIPEAGGIMHCFSGSLEMVQDLERMGFYISFPGVVTYKNARSLPEAAMKAAPDRILIETDCPFLAPVPHRGRRNEPAYLRLTAETIARLRQVPLRRIAEATTANAFKAFGLTR